MFRNAEFCCGLCQIEIGCDYSFVTIVTNLKRNSHFVCNSVSFSCFIECSCCVDHLINVHRLC